MPRFQLSLALGLVACVAVVAEDAAAAKDAEVSRESVATLNEDELQGVPVPGPDGKEEAAPPPKEDAKQVDEGAKEVDGGANEEGAGGTKKTEEDAKEGGEGEGAKEAEGGTKDQQAAEGQEVGKTSHVVTPDSLLICGLKKEGVVTVKDDNEDCFAVMSLASANPAVAEVQHPFLIDAVKHDFRVAGVAEGNTEATASWSGPMEGPCADQGRQVVPVRVRKACAPICNGNGEMGFGFEPETGPDGKVVHKGQYQTTTRQKGANVVAKHDPTNCDCSLVIMVQTIKIGDGDWEVDVDKTVTGSDSPFYNYDPKTGGTVPATGLGAPGKDGNGATLQDHPLQSTQPVKWEVCAVCCDDGRVLDCWSWSYDPKAPRGTTVDGIPQHGLYSSDGPIDGFSDGSKKALKKKIDKYRDENKSTAEDPCLKNFGEALEKNTKELMNPRRNCK